MNPVLEYARPVQPPIDWGKFAYGALPAFWGAFILGPFSFFLLPMAVAGTVVLAVRRRWVWLAATVLLCPMSVSLGRGVVEYWGGTARMEGRGLMRHPGNVDPTTRLQRTSGGCIVTGNEWMSDGFHDLGVRWMLAWFGTMPGAYDGPYPDEATSYAMIVGAKPLDLNDLAKDKFAVDGVMVKLRAGLGKDLLKGFYDGPATNIADRELLKTYGEAHAMVHAGRCVIIEIPAAKPGTIGPLGARIEHRTLILLDTVNGKVFAHYYDRKLHGFMPRAGTVWR